MRQLSSDIQKEPPRIDPCTGWDHALEEIEAKIRGAFPEFEIYIVCVPHPSDQSLTIPVLCYDSQNGNKLQPFDFSALVADHHMAHLAPRILCRVDKFPKRNNVILRKELQRKVLKTMKFQNAHRQHKNS
jgi:hypothetical protein